MRNTELVPAEVSLEVGQPKKRRLFNIRPWDIPLRMLGILFAGAMPVSGLAPFGISFLTIDRRFSLKSVLNLIFVSAGYMLLFDFWLAVKYISACVIFETVIFVIERNENPPLSFAAGAAGISMFACETAVLFAQGFTAAGFILVICDTLLMLVGTLVFDHSRDVLLENKFLSRGLLTDEKISLSIMCGIILLSTRYLTILNTFNFSNFLACLMIGIVALTDRGVARCAVSGILAGIILGLTNSFPEYVAVFTICGLVLGVAARFGKKGVCISLLMFGAAILLYMRIPVGYEHIPNIYEVAAAAALIYLAPRNIIIAADKILDFETDDSDETHRFRRYVGEKLNCISDSFMEIAQTFENMSDSRSNTDMSEISLMFDTAADRVCKNCDRADFCWKNDFSATYTAMFKFLEIMERKGYMQLSDVPKAFSDKCVHLLPLINEINRLFEIYKINITWKSKLQENRELTAQQFKGISDIIKNASEEICDENTFDIEAADELMDILCDMGICAERVDVIRGSNQKYTVEVIISGCKDCTVCRKNVKAAIKRVLGINVATPYNLCESRSSGKCKVRFCQVEGFEPIVGVASAARDGKNGDTHRTDYLSGGKLAITISDGMGTGGKAARESDVIINLLGCFLDAGFDKKIAVKLADSVMVMKSARDIFATVDMCIIDLYTAQVEFIKNGAEPSFIKTPQYTETVRAASLPIGIVPLDDIEVFGRTLENGSMLIMTSDGVTAPPDDPWIKELLEFVDIDIPPKELAKIILDEAVKRNENNKIKNDDMTVICVKLNESSAA